MKALQLSIILVLVLGSNAIVFGQREPETISLSPGQSKTVKGTGRKNVLKTYPIKVSSRTDITVTLKNISGQVGYALTQEGGHGENVSIENGTYQINYKTSPLTIINKDGRKDFFIQVEPKTPKANFQLIVSARPITYKNYTIKTCKGIVPIKIGSFDGVEPNYVDDDLKYDDSSPYVGVGRTAFGDLNGDGGKEVIVASHCEYSYEERKKSFNTFHVFDLSTGSTSELTQLKDEELFQLNKRETGDHYWMAVNFKINNQKFERDLQRIYSDGDDIRPTNNIKKGSFELRNNRLVAVTAQNKAGTTNKIPASTITTAQSQKFIFTKDSITFEIKQCRIEEKELTCSLSITSNGKDVETFYIYDNGGGVVDGDGNQFTSYNSNSSSRVLVDGIPVSAKIAFQTSNPRVAKIARLDISYNDGQNAKYITFRNIPILSRYSTNNALDSDTSSDDTSAAEGKRSIGKMYGSFEVPAGWTTVMERDDMISLALPQDVKQINNKSDVTFGVLAGSTAIKANTAKTAFNILFKEPVINTKGLDDASKWFVKEKAKQFAYKQTGSFQQTLIDGKPAMQAQIEGISKATGKSETVSITTALMSDGKLFYLMTIYPSNAKSADTRVFEEVRNSVRLP